MFPLALAGGLLSTGMNIAQSIKQNKLAKRAAAQADENNRKSLGYANDVLDQAKTGQAEARNLYQARMANAGNIEKDIYQNQANTLGSLSKNTTDASQLLSLAGSVQGNSNQAFNQLQQTENEDKQRRYYNVMGADQNVQSALGNIANVYGNQAQMAQQSANELKAASMQNMQNGVDNISNIGIMAGMGQFGNLGFGGKGGSRTIKSSVTNPNRQSVGAMDNSGILGKLPPLNGVNLSLPSTSMTPYPSMQTTAYNNPLQYTNPFIKH